MPAVPDQPILEILDTHQAGVPTEGEHSYGEECKCTQKFYENLSLETFINKIINNKHTHNKPIDKWRQQIERLNIIYMRSSAFIYL